MFRPVVLLSCLTVASLPLVAPQQVPVPELDPSVTLIGLNDYSLSSNTKAGNSTSGQPGGVALPGSGLVDATNMTVVASQTRLGGRELQRTAAESAEACGSACRARADCLFFDWCTQQDGCPGAGLAHQGCLLLAPSIYANGSSGDNSSISGNGSSGVWSQLAVGMPEVAAKGGEADTVAGFPLRLPIISQELTFSTFPGLGVAGGDIPCTDSVIPGRCALHDVTEAVMRCSYNPGCRTVTVFTEGTPEHNGTLALLSLEALSPSNSYAAPTVYAYSLVGSTELSSYVMLDSEGTMLLPTEQDSNDTSWHGCFIIPNALAAGVVTLPGSANLQPSAEACCRSCASFTNATGGPACNVWNYCNQTSCSAWSANTTNVHVQLSLGECELRFQATATADNSWPPAVLAKGSNINFIAGTPMALTGHEIPGYRMLPGRGFKDGGFSCEGSLTPYLQQCVLPGSLPELAKRCDDDPNCAAFFYKSSYMSAGSAGNIKHSLNSTTMLINPTNIMYLKDNWSPAQNSTDASAARGLPVGTIFGIAVGAAAAAALVAIALVMLVKRAKAPAARPNLQRQTKADSSSKDEDGRELHVVTVRSSAGKASCPVLLTRTYSPDSCVNPGIDSFPAGISAPSSSSSRPSHHSGCQSPAGRCGPGHLAGPGSNLLRPSEEAGHDTSIEVDPGVPPGTSAPDCISEMDPSTCNNGHFSLDMLPPQLRKCVVQPSQLSLLRKPNGKLHMLGSGAHGKVYKALFEGEVVAAKEIALSGQGSRAQRDFVKEALRLHDLRHPHIVGFVGVCISEAGDTGTIIMECCEGRDLFSLLPARVVRRSSTQLGSPPQGDNGGSGLGMRPFGWYGRGRQICCDIARGLNYLHRNRVVHMDIKSSNVLLTARGEAKLADVGFTKLIKETYLSDLGSSMVGTFAWAAPEILLGAPCTEKVDIYSFGIVLWEVVTGERPERGSMRAVRVPEECPQEVASLIKRCTALEPGTRPCSKEVLAELTQLSSCGRSISMSALPQVPGGSLGPSALASGIE